MRVWAGLSFRTWTETLEMMVDICDSMRDHDFKTKTHTSCFSVQVITFTSMIKWINRYKYHSLHISHVCGVQGSIVWGTETVEQLQCVHVIHTKNTNSLPKNYNSFIITQPDVGLTLYALLCFSLRIFYKNLLVLDHNSNKWWPSFQALKKGCKRIINDC